MWATLRVLYVSPRFIETCDCSELSDREAFVFLALFIRKEDFQPQADIWKPCAAHFMLCWDFFFCQIVDHPKSNTYKPDEEKSVISLYLHFASCSALSWHALAPRRDRRFPLLFRDNSVCCSPLCLSKKVLPKISYITHSPECVLLWSCSSQYKENNDDQDEILK